jgi:hypothetical protein
MRLTWNSCSRRRAGVWNNACGSRDDAYVYVLRFQLDYFALLLPEAAAAACCSCTDSKLACARFAAFSCAVSSTSSCQSDGLSSFTDCLSASIASSLRLTAMHARAMIWNAETPTMKASQFPDRGGVDVGHSCVEVGRRIGVTSSSRQSSTGRTRKAILTVVIERVDLHAALEALDAELELALVVEADPSAEPTERRLRRLADATLQPRVGGGVRGTGDHGAEAGVTVRWGVRRGGESIRYLQGTAFDQSSQQQARAPHE